MTDDMRRLLAAIALGGLVAGALDITYAITFWAVKGVPAERVLQSVASGLLGRDAYAGGAPIAALGLLLHFLIAAAMAAAYVVASRRLRALVERPIVFGALYGLLLYAIMNYVVLPLSAFPGAGQFSWPSLIGGLCAHTLLVGIPIALFARRALRPPAAQRWVVDEQTA